MGWGREGVCKVNEQSGEPNIDCGPSIFREWAEKEELPLEGWEENQENTVSRGEENGIKCQMLPTGKGDMY